MSDEIRDLLKRRADDVPVPPENLTDVLRGGNARRWRNRAYSFAVVLVVVVVGWTTIPGLVESFGWENPTIASTPTPNATRTSDPTPPRCAAPFRPMYLPDGWSYERQKSDTANSLGRYSTPDGEGGSVEIFLSDGYYRIAPGEGDPLEVLDDEGQSGTIHEGGLVVEFLYDDCSYSVSTYTESEEELRRIAEALRPTDTCTPMPVGDRILNLGDGRFFGYIRAINSAAVEFDRAEFLTGAEATSAAVQAGDIDAGETVPNDYYIVNDSRATGTLALAKDVRVIIDTIQDGIPGPAPADLLWLTCEFADVPPDDETRISHATSPFWLTAKDGRIVKIEEQYLP